MKIMVIGAHPADAIDLAGGAIARHHRNMVDDIMILSVTDGINSHTQGDYDINEKRQELITAVSCLQFKKSLIDVTFMGLQDEPLIVNSACISDIIERIRNFKPDMLISHHPNEYAHWDHAEAGKMVCRALKGAIKRPGDKWWVPDVYFFATQFRPEVARLGYNPLAPNVLIDIEDVIHKKVEAMCCFKSQGHNDKSLMWDRMNSMENEMGRSDGLKYAEGFISYYPLKERKLPISSINKAFYIKGDKNGE